jgi:hypothetical protein
MNRQSLIAAESKSMVVDPNDMGFSSTCADRPCDGSEFRNAQFPHLHAGGSGTGAIHALELGQGSSSVRNKIQLADHYPCSFPGTYWLCHGDALVDLSEGSADDESLEHLGMSVDHNRRDVLDDI